MRETMTFAIASALVRVHFDAPGFSDWLEEVLLPAFTRTDDEPSTISVVVTRGHDGRAKEARGNPIGMLPCFVFDREIVHLPASRAGDSIALIDTKYGAHYRLSPELVEVHADGPWPRTRSPVLRVVRELAMAQSLAHSQRIRLHASGVEDAGRVVLFMGPKGAGKTTLLAHLASSTGIAIVANDCALVSRSDAGTWDARPVPISISVRAETMRRLPHAFVGVPAVDALMQHTLAEGDAAAALHGIVTEPTRLKLSPALFARELRSSLSSGGRLASIAMLTVEPRAVGFAARLLGAAEAERRLTPLRYGFESRVGVRTVFEELLGLDCPDSADAKTLRLLAADVPCFELRMGPDVLGSRETARALLEVLL
jgi:hypothetical protein